MPIIEIDAEKYHVTDDQDHVSREEILALSGRSKHVQWVVTFEYPGYEALEMRGSEVKVMDGMVIRTY